MKRPWGSEVWAERAADAILSEFAPAELPDTAQDRRRLIVALRAAGRGYVCRRTPLAMALDWLYLCGIGQRPSWGGMMYLSLRRPLAPGIGHISQHFGAHDVDYKPLAGHPGLDYGCIVGMLVCAPVWGCIKVADSGTTGYGLHVELTNEICTVLLAHLSEVLVGDGQLVAAGERIAKSGNTGRSTDPHLHMGLKIVGLRNPAYGDWLDPEPFRDI